METAFFVPILPGKTQAARDFAHSLMTDKKEGMDNSNVTVTRESWHLQQTEHGDFMIVYYESPDGEQVMKNLAESQEPFDLWFKQQVLEITGVDVTQPMPGGTENVLSWSR